MLFRYYNDLNHCIYHLIMLAGIVAGIIRFKKLIPGSRIFLLLLIITPVTELIAYYCAVKYHDNRFVYNIFNLIQFALICLAFYTESRMKIIFLVFAVFIAFITLNSIFFQPLLSSSNSNGLMVEQLLIIVVYFIYLVAYFKRTDLGYLKVYPLFWIGLGWLLFSVTSIVSFGFNSLSAPGSYWDNISDWVKRISNYLLYLSFCIAFLSAQKTLNDITERE